MSTYDIMQKSDLRQVISKEMATMANNIIQQSVPRYKPLIELGIMTKEEAFIELLMMVADAYMNIFKLEWIL